MGILDFPGQGTWVVPEGWSFRPTDRPTRCRSCGAHVLWLVSRNARPAPFDHDGVNHFATCPQAESWRKK